MDLTGENIKKHLKTKNIGKNIIHYVKIDSTNAYAKNMGNMLEHGTVITCEEQTAGRGRLGRTWEARNGSMCMSIFLKPEINLYQVSKITLVCAAAVSLALEELGINAEIKWPNDIILNKDNGMQYDWEWEEIIGKLELLSLIKNEKALEILLNLEKITNYQLDGAFKEQYNDAVSNINWILNN